MKGITHSDEPASASSRHRVGDKLENIVEYLAAKLPDISLRRW